MSSDDVDSLESSNGDSYANHLARVNESKTVVATRDIVNDQNAVIVKAGRQIDEETTRRIVKFKLLRPLEESVAIEGDIDGATLALQIEQLVAGNCVAARIHEQHQLGTVISWLSNIYHALPILRQKITVLSIRLQDVYRQTLFSTWLATVIGVQMRLSPQEQGDLFIAAVGHDIGMLHVDEAVVNKKGSLSPEEWRRICAHPIIGEKIFANIPNISPATIRAVREHHERCDGTGYPAGKKENDLHQLGQIIALADTSAAVLNRFHDTGRGFRDILPVLQINGHAHFKGVYDAFILILKKADLGNERLVTDEQISQFISHLITLDQELSTQYQRTFRALQALDYEHNDPKLGAMQRVVLNMHFAVRGAGILDEGYLRFLEQVKSEKLVHAYREVEDFSIMLDELKFQFHRLGRLIRDYLQYQTEAEGGVKEALLDILAGLESMDDTLASEG